MTRDPAIGGNADPVLIDYSLRFGPVEALILFVMTGIVVATTVVGLLWRGRQRSVARWLSITATALVLGCGLWSMHHIHSAAVSYWSVPSHDQILSLGIALLISAFAGGTLYLMAGARSRYEKMAAGFTFGFVLALGHYCLTVVSSLPVGYTISAISLCVSLALSGVLGAFIALINGDADYRGNLPARIFMMCFTLVFIASGITLHRYSLFDWAKLPHMASDIPLAAIGSILVISAFSVLVARGSRNRQRSLAEMNRIKTLADVAFEGIVVCRDGRIVHANTSFAKLLSRPGTQLVDTHFEDLLTEKSCDMLGALDQPRFEAEILGLDGPVAVEIFTRDVMLHDAKHRVLAVRDIRERKLAEARVQFLAHHDPITGLPNRTLYLDRLEQEINRTRRSQGQFSIICVDLDRFKDINDGFGHAAGDLLLRLASERLKRVFRTYDVVGRIGGDEFAVLQCAAAQPDSAVIAAHRLLSAFAEPFDLDGLKVTVGVSAGIAIFPDDAGDAESLLARADMALYRAKSEGRGTFRMFESGMDTQLRERRLLAGDLRSAILNDDITLHYQPTVQLSDSSVTGFEAMMRWRHASRGWIAPSVFIPLAEEIGMMRELGERALRRACSEAQSWPRPLTITVDLASSQLHDLENTIQRVLADTGLDPTRLGVELTESALNSRRDVITPLKAVKAQGVSIVLDHFGTGPSSLSSLRSCPIDRIKIDKSFVCGIEQDYDAAALVQAISSVGQALGITISAIGCDSFEQAELLAVKGCVEAQGALFGEPMPIAAYAHITGRFQAEADASLDMPLVVNH